MELTPIQKSLNIAYQPHPVAPLADRKFLIAELDGMTSVRRVLLMAGIDPHQPITVQLDGQLLTVDEWDSVCPSAGQLLSVHATVQGGGGGGSNVVQIVAIIAIAIAAPYLGGLAAGALGFTAGTAAFGAVAAGIGAAITIGGSLVIGAIFAPNASTAPNTTATTVSPTYSLSGGQNRARPYEPMPVVFGTHRLFLDYAARPYTEYRGEDQYLYQIFNLGLGTVTASDYKIGTTSLTSYADYQLITPDANGKLLNFPANVDSSAGGTLTAEAGYITRTTSANTYQIGIDLESVAFFANDKGGLEAYDISFEIQYKLSTDSGFTNATSIVINSTGNYINLGSGIVQVTSSTQKPQRATIFIPVSVGTYDVRVRRLTADSTNPKIVSSSNWSSLRSYQQDTADYRGQNRIGIIIKASEQLNGVVQTLSATVTAQARYWNGTAFVTGATNNPAHWFMHFAKGVYNSDNKLMYGVGLSDSQIDYAGLHVWSQFCTTEGLTFDAVLDSTQTASDMLNSIATCGFASASWASGKLGAIFDTPNASPVMAFGMSNIIRDSFQVAYISENLAEELVIRFSNPDKNYEQDEVRTLAPEVVTPLRTSSIDLYGCTNATMAGKFANYLAAQQYYRRRRITWQSDFEGFVCQRGDVVLLSHDLTQWGYSGRFIGVSNNIVTLDRTVPRQNQTEYLMLIRPDGTTTTYDVQATTNTESDTLTVINDVITFQSGANLIDHRWTFSPLATPGKKLKILSVQPASDARLTIVATDESEAFYTAWDGTFTPPQTETILPAQPVTATNLTVSNQITVVDGFLTNRVAISWGVGGGTLYSQVKVYLNGDLIGQVADTRVPYYQLDINASGSLLVEVTPFGLIGAGITQTATLTIAELDLPSPPTTVTLESGESGRSATFKWTTVAGVQSYVVEIFANGAVKRSVNVGNTLSYVYTVAQAVADGGPFRSYQVRVYSVNLTGQSSTYASANFSNPQIGQLVNAAIDPMPNSLWFSATKPTDDDYAGILVWISKTLNFTPASTDLIYEGAGTDFTISAYTDKQPLESGVTYYIRAAAYDTFGKDSLTLTGQLVATILSPAWGLLQDDIETSMLESGLRDRIDLIDTIGDPDMPLGLIQAVRREATDIAVLNESVDTIGEKLLESALKVQENTDLLYDAGVTVDSTTGEVYIFAVRENANEINEVGIRLDAAEANINLKASTTYVDNAILEAVIDPSQIAELGALEARVATAEIDIDGLDAAILLKADLLTVNSQGARLTTAEVDIDALQGEIVLKASNTDLTTTTARVSTVETTLNSLDVPSITQSVTDVKYVSKATDQIAITQLKDILTGEANYKGLDYGIAVARQDLTAYTDGKLLAEATARLELSAELAQTAASLDVESVARATADSALSSQVTTLASETSDNASSIANEITARTTADSALATSISELVAEVEDNSAALVNESTVRANADSALSTSITNLQALTGSNLAAIEAETIARTTADSALSSSVTTLQSTVGANTTSIQTNATSIDGIEAKYTVKIDNNGYVSGYGLISTNNNATPFAEFAIIADRFAIAPVATNPTAVDGSPFFVLTASTVIDGVSIPAGTYMKKAFIHDATITTAKINNLAVTDAKIANLAVTTAKIADANITTAKILDANITNAKIANLAVTTAKIGDAQITNAKVLSLDATKITTGFLDANRINVGSIDAKIATINNAQIANGAITNAKIANASIDAVKIIDGEITNAKIQNGAITSAKIGDAQITTAKIGTAQIDTLRVAGNAVTVQASVSSYGTTNFSFTAAQAGQVLIVTYVEPVQFQITYTVRFNGADVNYVTGVQYNAEQFLYTSETKIAIVNAVAGVNTVSLFRGSTSPRLVVCTAFLSMR